MSRSRTPREKFIPVRVRYRPMRVPWFRGLIRAAAAVALSCASAAAGMAQAITTKLNTIGRAIDMPVPLMEGRTTLGEVVLRLNPDDSVLLHKDVLAALLEKQLNASVYARLVALAGPFVALDALASAGLDVKFDPALQELVVAIGADQRAVGSLSIGARGRPAISQRLAEPADVAGYVNILGSLDWVWGGSSPDVFYTSGENAIGRLDFESAVRVAGAVIENRAVYKSTYEAFLCPDPLNCSLGFAQGFHRQSSRVVYDLPQHTLRLIAGDNDPIGLAGQGMPEFLGFSIEKAPEKFGEGASQRASPKSTFRIERPSDVEVRINGVTFHRARLMPGMYDVRDLPVATGANEIELRISDESGATETKRLSAYYDTRLIREGASEWALLGGLPSALLGEERIYSDEGLFASGFLRFGISDGLTLEAHAQADREVAMSGIGAIAQTPWGIAALRGSISHSDEGLGASAGFDWSMLNFRGVFGDRGHSFRLSGEYRTADMELPGGVVTRDIGIVTRPAGYRARLDSFYSFPLTADISATFSVRYLKQPTFSYLAAALPQAGDSYGADLTLASPLTSISQLALTIGYAKEPRWADVIKGRDVEGEFRAIARLSIRPDAHSTISASYDTAHQSANVSAYRYGESALGRWQVSVNAAHNGEDANGALGGSASLTGNRAELTLAHGASSMDGIYFGLDGRPSYQRTTLRVGTAIAFADGALAVGPPIRNGAFAVVHPHASIADREVIVGDVEHPRARADWSGPALVTDLPAYYPASISIDVAELPVGYSLGAAAFDVRAPYKAGYRLEVGSAYSVYAHGTLLLASGEPVALLSGTAQSKRHPGRQVAIFTNAAGRFGAEGLAPGKWTIELATSDQPALYEIDIPAAVDGLFDAGTLRPVSNVQ